MNSEDIPPEAVSAADEIYRPGVDQNDATEIIASACREYASRDAWQSKAIAEMAAYENKLTALRAELEAAKAERDNEAKWRAELSRQIEPEVAALRKALLFSQGCIMQCSPCMAEECKQDQQEWLDEALALIKAALAATNPDPARLARRAGASAELDKM